MVTMVHCTTMTQNVTLIHRRLSARYKAGENLEKRLCCSRDRRSFCNVK
jgi:hypothetical protein